MPASANAQTSVPSFEPDETKHRRRIAAWAGEVMQGHINATGSVTLAANTVSTVVSDARVGINSVPVLQPATANALSAAPTVWVSTIGKQTFTITHANTSATDKTFRYVVLT